MKRLDIVVNCAGITSTPGMPFSRNTPEDWERTLAVNLKGAVRVCQQARDALIASDAGRIVNIASITGVIAAAYMPPYSVSKAALIAFTRVLARELAPHHVCANAVCPGFVRTPLWEALGEDMASHAGRPANEAAQIFDERVAQLVPMQREQTAEDVADLVAFITYMSDPSAGTRVRLGAWVLMFLALFTVFAWNLNRVYWKDVK